MTTMTKSPVALEAHEMAKAKGPGGRQPVGKQLNFRASEELVTRLESVAGALEQDVSALIRLILARHLHTYEEQARQVLEEKAKSKGG